MMAKLHGYDPGQASGDMAMEMAAEFSEDGKSRLSLRYTWDRSLPAAAWFMNNPSQAGRPARDGSTSPTFDPTATRTIHFSRMLGCGTAWLVNWCPMIATEPADLWLMLKADGFPPGLELSNHLRIAPIAAAARFRIMACGAEGLRRHPVLFRAAAAVFVGAEETLCLGTTDGGAPLHPLARGKHAIRNATRPVPFHARDWIASNGR